MVRSYHYRLLFLLDSNVESLRLAGFREMEYAVTFTLVIAEKRFALAGFNPSLNAQSGSLGSSSSNRTSVPGDLSDSIP